MNKNKLNDFKLEFYQFVLYSAYKQIKLYLFPSIKKEKIIKEIKM